LAIAANGITRDSRRQSISLTDTETTLANLRDALLLSAVLVYINDGLRRGRSVGGEGGGREG